MNNQEISITAIQQRLMNLETEIIMKDSQIEALQKRVEELENSTEE